MILKDVGRVECELTVLDCCCNFDSWTGQKAGLRSGNCADH